ncbi:AMP-binding protein [Azospira restricta]|uniref:Long-chain-fatty-acid--CoA ligase n=1 Tax=Azospira restricta TaxID=404405 RepID=A0A974Y4R2_9RHOO|nr:AMP-binding protein [Azospira restricta]QRJ64755.1 acyl-CoA synthetase [Azospira restricta]
MDDARLYPLTGHGDPAATIAWRRDGPVSVARFLADVHRLAALLPAGGHLLNLCQDRYRFMVGLAAGLVAGRISLQPSSQAPETVRQLLAFAPDTACLHDDADAPAGLPCLRYPDEAAASDAPFAMPQIPGDRIAAYVFTSGSTGAPVPHAKHWGALVRNARAEAERLGLGRQGHAIVGTVPAQHMYGFESTVLLALHGNCAAWSGRPFYPADIAAALAAVPRPRLLVTTPFHLRALLDAGLDLPPIDQLLSATAPLSEALARAAEARCAAPLNEIYGCTETGQIASRRTVDGPRWRLLPGVALDLDGDLAHASGGHVEGRVALADLIEPLDREHFLLHGRSADLINIAGKRSSLAYLNHQLAAIAGVADGAFYLPDEEAADGVTRLAAFVVAPTLTRRELLAALRQRIDPIFLPRPLVLLDRLPRNATGKLPRDALQALFALHREGRGDD